MVGRWLQTVLFLTVLPVLTCFNPSHSAGRVPPRVYVLQSYNPEYVWCQHIDQGIAEALESTGAVIRHSYMDAKRKPSPGWLRKVAEAVLAEIRTFDPDVVIAADDVAQQYVVAPYLKDKPRPQVVFCGVNAPVSLYGYPASNVSGVRERWHFREGFALVKRIVPDAGNIVFLMDDSESSHYVIDDLHEDQAKGGPFALKLAGVESVRNFSQWKAAVLKYRDSADTVAIGLYQTILDDGAGKVVPPEEVAAWTAGAMPKPSLGFADVAIEHGVLCGILESGHEQGYLAGEMARAVLERGLKAGELPVRINQKGVIMVNLKTAERLGVEIPYEIIEAAGVVIK